jgi:hypothetical protein
LLSFVFSTHVLLSWAPHFHTNCLSVANLLFWVVFAHKQGYKVQWDRKIHALRIRHIFKKIWRKFNRFLKIWRKINRNQTEACEEQEKFQKQNVTLISYDRILTIFLQLCSWIVHTGIIFTRSHRSANKISNNPFILGSNPYSYSIRPKITMKKRKSPHLTDFSMTFH